MQIKSIRTVYTRPRVLGGNTEVRNNINYVNVLTNELHQLEQEKRIVEMQIGAVEKKIQEVWDEMNNVNDIHEEKEKHAQPEESLSRVRHITIKY